MRNDNFKFTDEQIADFESLFPKRTKGKGREDEKRRILLSFVSSLENIVQSYKMYREEEASIESEREIHNKCNALRKAATELKELWESFDPIVRTLRDPAGHFRVVEQACKLPDFTWNHIADLPKNRKRDFLRNWLADKFAELFKASFGGVYGDQMAGVGIIWLLSELDGEAMTGDRRVDGDMGKKIIDRGRKQRELISKSTNAEEGGKPKK